MDGASVTSSKMSDQDFIAELTARKDGKRPIVHDHGHSTGHDTLVFEGLEGDWR